MWKKLNKITGQSKVFNNEGWELECEKFKKLGTWELYVIGTLCNQTELDEYLGNYYAKSKDKSRRTLIFIENTRDGLKK